MGHHKDLQIEDGVQKFIVRGKGPKKIGLLCKETNTAIENYLAERSSSVPKDRLGDPDLELQPLFVGISKTVKLPAAD